MDNIILFLKRVGLLYIISSALSLNINFKDWNALSIWVFIIILVFTMNDMFLFKLKYFNLAKNVGTRPHIQHRPKPMIRKKIELTEIQSTAITNNAISTLEMTKLSIDRLNTEMPLLYLGLNVVKKFDFLEAFLQLEHDNPFSKSFYKIFPEFKYDTKTWLDQIEEFILEERASVGAEKRLIEFFKSLKSPLEILRFHAVYNFVKGDKLLKEKFLKDLYELWEAEKSPIHYFYLIEYTKIKMLRREFQDAEALELILFHDEKSENDKIFDLVPNLKLRFEEL